MTFILTVTGCVILLTINSLGVEQVKNIYKDWRDKQKPQLKVLYLFHDI